MDNSKKSISLNSGYTSYILCNRKKCVFVLMFVFINNTKDNKH